MDILKLENLRELFIHIMFIPIDAISLTCMNKTVILTIYNTRQHTKPPNKQLLFGTGFTKIEMMYDADLVSIFF